jgi:uncharacterized membrane-anchored protein YjiN (DUF445 family)
MKARATSLLVLAAAVFVAAKMAEDGRPWVGYVRAMAEAAMVGGLADWFAVTALFRHPLGIPVPHTAIIPTRKEHLGRTLGEFVEQNFLIPEVITEKLRAARPAQRAATWVGQDGNPAAVARHLSVALAGTAEVLRDEEVQVALEGALLSRVRTIAVSPAAGRALAIATSEGRHQELIDAGIKGAIRFLETNRYTLRSRFGRESPWWVPETIDDRIFDKLYTALAGFLAEVGAAPNHEFRRYLDERASELIVRLQEDPELIARGEKLKEELLAHPAVRRWSASLWVDLKAALQAQAAEPGSELRMRIEAAVSSVGASLRSDPELQAKIDGWLESVVLYIVRQERHQATELITSTVARWDPADASRRIEVAVGRDLQFIRINGTLVGGLAGLAIHAIGQLIG